jgi:hypothetical protein
MSTETIDKEAPIKLTRADRSRIRRHALQLSHEAYERFVREIEGAIKAGVLMPEVVEVWVPREAA